MAGSGSATVVNPSLEGWFGETATSEISSATSSDSSFNSEMDGTTEGESVSETKVPVWVPIPTQELTTETDWTLEEKLSKVVEILKCQQQRHCFIKLNTELTQPLCVPLVKDYGVQGEALLEYEHEVHQLDGARTAADVDRILVESKQKFLQKAGELISTPAAAPEKDDPLDWS